MRTKKRALPVEALRQSLQERSELWMADIMAKADERRKAEAEQRKKQEEEQKQKGQSGQQPEPPKADSQGVPEQKKVGEIGLEDEVAWTDESGEHVGTVVMVDKDGEHVEVQYTDENGNIRTDQVSKADVRGVDETSLPLADTEGTQPLGETIEGNVNNEGGNIENTNEGNQAPENKKGEQGYILSELDSGRGGRFYQNDQGSVDLVELPDDLWAAIGGEKTPFRLTESMAKHVYERHGKELGLESEADTVGFIVDVMRNADHVRRGRGNTLVFSIENGRRNLVRRVITVEVDTSNGLFTGIKTAGYDRLTDVEKLEELWARRENESVPEGAAPSNVASAPASGSGSPTGITSNQNPSASGGKDTTSSQEKQAQGGESSPLATALSFKSKFSV
ncbi:MAG: hypothetical protein LIO91_02650 [Bacteroidales bacterium]|nr:hypothetical protein [Bacteroidales bacterium]